MKSNISIDAIPAMISKLLHRYHVVLFTVLILGGLAAAMFMISQIINTSTDTTELEQQSQVAAPFDKKTIEQLEQLEDTNDANELMLPDDERINPFVEQ